MKVKRWKLGDRVICPNCDQVPGTVIELGYGEYTKVRYDDGIIGDCMASDLAAAPSSFPTTSEQKGAKQ